MNKRGRQAGYTLVELLVVLVVLSIIVAIALVSILNAMDKAKQRATMADMRTISKALEVYAIDFGYVPVGGSDMATLRTVLTPYQSSVLPISDHWGNEYSYSANSNGDYTVESFGKDGIDNQDITLATRFDFNRDIVLSNGQFTASPE